MERFVIIVKGFYNEGKSVAAERFIWTSKNKIFKHMTAISKNVYFDVSDDIVNKHKNTFHRTKKVKYLMLHLILMLNTVKNQTKKILNLKLVIVSEYQNIKTFLLKNTLRNWSENIFVVSKIKDTVPPTYVISDLNGEPIA